MQRILLVEDNEMNRDLISRRLKRRGFEVSVAVDGAEGVERATADLPDLILMDMGLPVLDGYEATRMLRDTESTRRLPIIGLSAHAMAGDASKALAAGCDDYDTKPVDWTRLLGKIETLLTRVRETDAESEAAVESESVEAETAVAHILVIDDNALHRDMLSGRLASLGHRAEVVADSATGLARLETQSFDALLLDVTLPEIDGRSPLEVIRADERWSDLPILMLSTVDAIGAAIECLAKGAEDFVPQPFHQEVLAARINSCLERARLRREKGGTDGASDESIRSEHLLATLLPPPLVTELRETRKVLPRRCPEAVVLSCDVVGFSALSDTIKPLESGRRLQRLIVAFEEITQRLQLEKVGGHGESFTAAGGLFTPSAGAGLSAVRCALEMRQTALDLEADWRLRIGIHQGALVAGALGHRKVQFTVWGSAARIAARVQRAGSPGGVHVSGSVWQQVAEHCEGRHLGNAKLEDGGTLAVYRVDRLNG